MAIEFQLPELGEGVDEAEVARIYVSEGDEIDADQNVMELETEKAVADLPCPHAGKVTQVHVSEGDQVHVGQTILTIEEVSAEKPEQDDEPEGEKEQAEERLEEEEQQQPSGEKAEHQAEDKEEPGAERDEKKDETQEKRDEQEAAAPQAAEQKGQASEQEREEPKQHEQRKSRGEAERKRTSDTGNGKADREAAKTEAGEREPRDVPPPAGPGTRRLARKLEVDLDELQPSAEGRIRPEDVVRAYVESGRARGIARRELPDFEQFGEIDREPLGKIARTSAERLESSWRTIPHVTQHGLADVTDLEARRRQFQDQADASTPRISWTALAVKALVGVLKRFPKFNSSLDTDREELVFKHYFHIGVAVDTPHGLLVPVIRDADRLSLLEIAGRIEQLAQQARNRQLGREQMQGATCTVSNQGGMGGGHFTPIVNWPEVAILGLGRTEVRLELRDDRPRERLKLPLSVSYDHRVVNGADAARFIRALEESLSGTFELLLAS